MSHPAPRLDDAILTRRELLCRSGMGMGALALGGLLADDGLLGRAARDWRRRRPGRPPRARRPQSPASQGSRRCRAGQAGRPPVHERRAVARRHLRPQADARPPSMARPVPTNLPTERKTGAAMGSPFRFQKYGQSGIEVSELFAHTAGMIDDICVIRSMHADVPNHEPSLMLMNCGEARQARPCVGSWVLYGLGTENQNLPGFIVMCPGGFPIAESQNWQAAFLPGIYQGTYIDSKHTEIEKLIAHIRNRAVGPKAQRAQLDLLAELNRRHLDRRPDEAELEARIQSFELAYRMQSEAAEAFDITQEPESIRAMYGPGVHAPPAAGDPAAAGARGPLRPALARRRPALGPPRRPGDRPSQPGEPVRPADRRLPAWTSSSAGCSTIPW